MPRKTKPIHPGEVLVHEFLEPMKISRYRLAKSINVPAIRISNIANGKTGISADTALRLARFFGTSAEFWMNLQSRYALEIATDALGRGIEKEVDVYAA